MLTSISRAVVLVQYEYGYHSFFAAVVYIAILFADVLAIRLTS